MTGVGAGWVAVVIPATARTQSWMIAAHLSTRPGHGVYMVAEPFVRNVWPQQQRLTPPIAAVPPSTQA